MVTVPADTDAYDKTALPTLTSGNAVREYVERCLMSARSRVADPAIHEDLAALCVVLVELDDLVNSADGMPEMRGLCAAINIVESRIRDVVTQAVA